MDCKIYINTSAKTKSERKKLTPPHFLSIGMNLEHPYTSETDSERRDELSDFSLREDEDERGVQPRDSRRRVAGVRGRGGSGVRGHGSGRGSGSTMSSGTFREKNALILSEEISFTLYYPVFNIRHCYKTASRRYRASCWKGDFR